MSQAEPDPFAGVAPALRDAMRARGFESLTAVKRAVIAAGVDGRDLRITSETGSGKTVALGLLLCEALASAHGTEPPAGPFALVIAPTRELAMQVREELSWLLGVFVGVTTGGTDMQRERRMLARRPPVLVATPGRLLDHVRSGSIRLDAVRQVALDEADRMLDMGFREELEAIAQELPAERRCHLVSATFPAPVVHLADRWQRDALHVQGTRLGEANSHIEHVVHVVLRDERYRALRNTLLHALGQRCLVFVQRRSDAAQVAEMLCADGFAAAPLSGELAQAQRTRTLEADRSGAGDVLVATDVAARGLDVADVSLVVHGDLPVDAESYTHRSGRTGRAGQRGRSVLLAAPSARRRVEAMLREARIDASWAPAPGVKQVRKAQRKRHRRALHALLQDESPPTDAMIEHARSLLEERDPAEVVAALLQLSQPQLPCEPVELTPPPRPRPIARPRPGGPRSGRSEPRGPRRRVRGGPRSARR